MLLQVVVVASLTRLAASLSPPRTASCSHSSSSSSGYDDVASKALLARIVFAGSFDAISPSTPTTTPSTGQGAGKTHQPLQRLMTMTVVTALFNVEKFYKGENLIEGSGGGQRIQVGAWQATLPDATGSISAVDCTGFHGLRQAKYLVFLNGSRTSRGIGEEQIPVESGASRGAGSEDVWWSIGRPEVWKHADEKIVEKLTCPTCKGRAPKATITPTGGLAEEDVLRRLTRTKFKLFCDVSGNPVPNIAWFKDSSVIMEGDNVEIDKFRLASQLVVSPARLTDSGTYWCEATNVVNSTQSKKVRVSITEDPFVSENDTSLPCSAEMLRVYCLNEGMCYKTKPPESAMHCRCTSQFEGRRCADRRMLPSKAELNPFPIAGLILTGLIFALLLLIIYLLRKFMKENKRMKLTNQEATGPRTTRVNGSANRASFTEFDEGVLDLAFTMMEDIPPKECIRHHSHQPTSTRPMPIIAVTTTNSPTVTMTKRNQDFATASRLQDDFQLKSSTVQRSRESHNLRSPGYGRSPVSGGTVVSGIVGSTAPGEIAAGGTASPGDRETDALVSADYDYYDSVPQPTIKKTVAASPGQKQYVTSSSPKHKPVSWFTSPESPLDSNVDQLKGNIDRKQHARVRDSDDPDVLRNSEDEINGLLRELDVDPAMFVKLGSSTENSQNGVDEFTSHCNASNRSSKSFGLKTVSADKDENSSPPERQKFIASSCV